MRLFDQKWFLKNQNILLAFANTFTGRYIFRINGKRSSVGKNKIVRISPNSITWKGKKRNEFVTEFRTHDKFSKRLYYAFKPLWYLFHLWDMAWYPRFNLGFDTLGPIYPAAGANSPCDGYVARQGVNEAWGTIRAGAGNDSGAAGAFGFIFTGATGTSNQYTSIYRFITNFDTSSLTAGAVISAATYSGYGQSKTNGLGGLNVALVNATPAATDNVANSDYGNVGTTREASDITYANWTTAGYNDFALNATGLAYISKTGITSFGHAFANDIDNSAPTWANLATSEMNTYPADTAGTTNDPKLVVTYTVPALGIYTII